MHLPDFFVPATGAPAGDYELYLLGLDWLPEAIQPCCASGECGSSAPSAHHRLLHGLWPRYARPRRVPARAAPRGPSIARAAAPTSRRAAASRRSDRRVSPSASGRQLGRPPAAHACRARWPTAFFERAGGGTRPSATCVAPVGRRRCTRWTAAEYFAESEKVHARAGARRRASSPRAGRCVARARRRPGARHRRGRLLRLAARRLTEIWFATPPASPRAGRFRREPDARRRGRLRGGRGVGER